MGTRGIKFVVAALAVTVLLGGCQNTSVPPAIRFTTPGAQVGIDVVRAYWAGMRDLDASPDGELWEVTGNSYSHSPQVHYRIRLAGPRLAADSTSGSNLDGLDPGPTFTGVGNIDDRAVGQAGVDVVEVETGRVICAGTGDPADTFSVNAWLHPEVSVNLRLQLHCIDPAGTTDDLSTVGTGQIVQIVYGPF